MGTPAWFFSFSFFAPAWAGRLSLQPPFPFRYVIFLLAHSFFFGNFISIPPFLSHPISPPVFSLTSFTEGTIPFTIFSGIFPIGLFKSFSFPLLNHSFPFLHVLPRFFFLFGHSLETAVLEAEFFLPPAQLSFLFCLLAIFFFRNAPHPPATGKTRRVILLFLCPRLSLIFSPFSHVFPLFLRFPPSLTKKGVFALPPVVQDGLFPSTSASIRFLNLNPSMTLPSTPSFLASFLILVSPFTKFFATFLNPLRYAFVHFFFSPPWRPPLCWLPPPPLPFFQPFLRVFLRSTPFTLSYYAPFPLSLLSFGNFHLLFPSNCGSPWLQSLSPF